MAGENTRRKRCLQKGRVPRTLTLDRVAAYQERTRKASRYVFSIGVLTMYIPPFLGVVALGFLGLDLWQVTMNVEKAATSLVDWT